MNYNNLNLTVPLSSLIYPGLKPGMIFAGSQGNKFAHPLEPPYEPSIFLFCSSTFVNILCLQDSWGSLTFVTTQWRNTAIPTKNIISWYPHNCWGEGFNTFIWSHEEMGRRSLCHFCYQVPGRDASPRICDLNRLWLMLILGTRWITEILPFCFVLSHSPMMPINTQA